MVLYSKFAYGSQFSEEKNDLTILHLVAKILGKNPVSFFLGRPVGAIKSGPWMLGANQIKDVDVVICVLMKIP